MKRVVFAAILFSLTFLISLFPGCGGKSDTPSPPAWEEREADAWGNYPELGVGPVTYTALPMDTVSVSEITPLGHLSPPGHPIPTSHTYWGLGRTDLGDPESGFSKPVMAPADGVITRITFTEWGGYDDYSITIHHTNTFMTRLNHLSEIDPSILAQTGPLTKGWDGNRVYIPVKAGDSIGKTAAIYGQSAALDFGTYDRNTLHFIDHEKYPLPIQNAVCPFDYFTNDLKTEIYSKVLRTEEPGCGEFDFDEEGKLVGNWFLEGKDGWRGEDGYKYELSFAYDMYDPQYLRVSLGFELGGGFLARVIGNAPDFRDVSVANGPVVYKLAGVSEGAEFRNEMLSATVSKTLLVEMISDEKIRIEVFEGDVANPSFTSKAKYYTR